MKRIFQVCGLVLLMSAGAFAQSATVSGTARDQSGAVLPGVQVTVTNTGTSLTRSVVTNERGAYVVPQLPIGNYQLTAELPGFKTAERSGIVLQVDQRATVEFDMQVGEVSERLLVTEAAPLVQSETSSVGSVVENKRIVELPLNGREFQNLTLLVPGTANPAQGSTLGFRGGISVSGTREEMTSFTLDGVDIVSGLVKAISFKPSIDMIQEFKVQTSTYSAEYGRTAGGQITATTKSGTNELHGTVYHFLRNNVLDAKNLFDPASEPIPGFKRNNFGFTIGGPIVKDRTFIFGNYEGLILRQAQTRTAAVPTAAMVSGDFSKVSKPIIDPVTGVQFPGNIIPASRMNPVGMTIARTYPLPNLAGSGSRNYVSTPIDRRGIHQFTVRVDHRISEHDNFFGRYSFDNDYEEDPFDIYNGITNLPSYGRADRQRAMSISLVDTHVFGPSLVGEFRLGYNRFRQTRTQLTLTDIPAKWGISGTTKSTNPIDYGYPAIRVTGFDPLGKGTLPSDRVDPIYQIIPSLTYNRGNHTIKIGGDISQYGTMRLNNGGGQGDFSFTGEYTGNGLADLLIGSPRVTRRSIGDTRNPMWNEAIAMYLQDDWKVTPRLTLNLGVRYDVGTPFRSTGNRLERFNPDTGVIEMTGNPSTRRDIGRVDNPAGPYYNAEIAQLAAGIKIVNTGKRSLLSLDHNDIAPRVGLAYRLLGNDRLVMRTGYGIFYNQLLGQYGQTGWNTFPFFVSQTFNASLPRPNISIENPFPVALAAASISTSSVMSKYRTGYVQNYNVGFQYSPFSDVLIDMTYAGSESTKLAASRNINQPRPSATGSVASRRPYQGFGNISFLDSVASANFNSFQMRIEKRYSRGLTLASAYTFSKSMDSTGNGDGDSGPPDNYNVRQTMYSVSTFDVKHRLVMSYVYDLPFGAGKRFFSGSGWVGRFLVAGWEISGITTFQSGRPFTVSITADNSNIGGSNVDRPNLVGNPYLPAGQRSGDNWFNTAAFAIPARGTVGNLGRNTMVGPPLKNSDLSLIKNNSFGENKKVQFRAEMFNFTNHPNLDLPNRFIDSNLAGKIFRAEASRQIQLGLKIVY